MINENDTTATDEIRFGDNDVLAAQVAIMLGAGVLVLLTDQDGLYTSDPDMIPKPAGSEARSSARARRVDVECASQRGVGGMQGKVAAALMAAGADVPRSSPTARDLASSPAPSSASHRDGRQAPAGR